MNGGLDALKVVSLLFNGISMVIIIVTVVIAVMKTRETTRNNKHIEAILLVISEMKAVDAGLLNQIVQLRGSTDQDIALLNERIGNINKMLEEIVGYVRAKK